MNQQAEDAAFNATATAFAVFGLAATLGLLTAGTAIVAVGLVAAFSIAIAIEQSNHIDITVTNCFAADTPILLADGSTKSIEMIKVGDVVMAFDKFGALTPRKVVRLFRNVTDRWLELSFETSDREPLIVTPGHRFLTADGHFETIERLLERGTGRATIVLADGSLASVRGKIIAFSEASKNFFERATIWDRESSGALALAAQERHGWATYNFEVEDLHTYVAGGVRVHNDSDGSLLNDSITVNDPDQTNNDDSNNNGDDGNNGDNGDNGNNGDSGDNGGGDSGVGGDEPVALDLDGNGIELIRRDRSIISFDLDHDGYRERTAWVGPHDGMLVIDLAANGAAGPDGKIDQDRDLHALVADGDVRHGGAARGVRHQS